MKNRIIKFRAWDTLQAKMYNTAVISPHNEIMISEPTKSGGRKWSLIEDIHIEKFSQYGYGDVILLQFTGLHDKNGKEIYEGDMVNCGGELNFQMIFEDGGFKLSENIKTRSLAGTLSKRGEIIGNIYQDSHLLDLSNQQ